MPENNEHDSNWYILLVGVLPEKEMLNLGSGLSIKRLSSPLTVFDLAAAGAAGFRAWAVLEPMAQKCWAEIETARDAAVTPGFDTLNRAWLASAMLYLRGFSQHLSVACNSYSWDIIAGHQKRTKGIFKKQLVEEGVDAAVHKSNRELPKFHGGLLDYHLSLLHEDNIRDDPVTEEDAEWIKENFNTFNELAADGGQFWFALEAAIYWRYSKDPRAAIARLWSGIEALFGISSELVYRISLLSASLLHPRGINRVNEFNEVKKLYKLRSKAVHGSYLSDKELSKTIGMSHFKVVIYN